MSGKKPRAAAAPTKAPAAGKSLQDFRAEHDKSYIVPKKIRDALAKLGEGWQYEVEFLRLAGLSTGDLATYREEFAEFTVTVGGRSPRRIWVGTKALAQQMREMI
jgi:hypothetical protein